MLKKKMQTSTGIDMMGNKSNQMWPTIRYDDITDRLMENSWDVAIHFIILS